MRNVGFIAFTAAGRDLALRLAEFVGADAGASAQVAVPERLVQDGAVASGSLAEWTAAHFASDDALVYVGATGIAVRAIAPHVADKLTDPAVVAIDEQGRFAVPLLSGHVGGANDLARALACETGGQAVVSTATDVNGLFAVDEWARKNGLCFDDRVAAKEVSAALLDGRAVGMKSELLVDGDLPKGLTWVDGGEIGIAISLRGTDDAFARSLNLVPRCVTVGVGCRKDLEPSILIGLVQQVLAEAGVSALAVGAVASIDVKAEEPAVHQLAQTLGCGTCFYSAEELAAVPGEFLSSAFVASKVGVDNVCERAACIGGEDLLVKKTARDGATVAVAARKLSLAFE